MFTNSPQYSTLYYHLMGLIRLQRARFRLIERGTLCKRVYIRAGAPASASLRFHLRGNAAVTSPARGTLKINRPESGRQVQN